MFVFCHVASKRCPCPSNPTPPHLLLGHVSLYILQLSHTLVHKKTHVIESQRQTVYCLFPVPDILFPQDISVRMHFSKVSNKKSVQIPLQIWSTPGLSLQHININSQSKIVMISESEKGKLIQFSQLHVTLRGMYDNHLRYTGM